MDTYCTQNDVQRLVERHGMQDQWNNLTDSKQKHLIYQATLDIEGYHQRPRVQGMLWRLNDLIPACAIQVVYLMRTNSASDIADRIRAITSGSYSDGNISVSSVNQIPLDPAAKAIINNVIEFDGGLGHTRFARG